jgi:hypothetical protein
MVPPTPRIQKWQKNQVFDAIKAIELDPAEFDLDNDDTATRIKHRWSESCFTIGGEPGHYIGTYIVGDGQPWRYDAYSWQAVMRKVEPWLNDVKGDLETPDLWAELQREAELLDAGSGGPADNTPFTLDEQKEIAERLRQIADDTKNTYSLSEAQVRALNAQVDYLVDAAGRLGHTDWRAVVISAMLSFVLSTALPPESARHLFFTLLRAIGDRYGFPELGGG